MRIAIAALLCTVTSSAPAKTPIVRWSHAEASKKIYLGKCPVRLVFTGTILTARKGDFTFAWKRSDGFVGRSRTIHATRRGQGWRVHDEWELYSTTSGWAQLWIQSEPHAPAVARFQVRCK
jgi:hypothetical protein